jgi:signal peptidase II
MGAGMLRRFRLFVPVTVAVLLLDQATKAWARDALAAGPRPVLDGHLVFSLGRNPGIAFSLLTHANARLVLTILGFAVLLAIVVAVARAAHPGRALLVGLALIGGGAAGNAIDRVLAGQVTDFVAVRLGSFRWPTFNLADAALVCGVIVLLLGARAPNGLNS